MATGYISEAVPELGGLYKFGICYGRDKTYDRFYSMWSKHDYPMLSVKKRNCITRTFCTRIKRMGKGIKGTIKKI